MRQRTYDVWEDPRFRKRKDQPKSIKLNRLGEAPCQLPAAHVPARVNQAIPSGMTAPPCPRPTSTASAPRSGPQRALSSKRPPPSRASGGVSVQSQGTARTPSARATISGPVVVTTRQQPVAHFGSRRQQVTIPRPSRLQTTCPPQFQVPQRPPTAAPCPPPQQSQMQRPVSRQIAAPSGICPPLSRSVPAPCPSSLPTCPPSLPPCPPQARLSGLPRRGGLRPPMAGRSGLRPPSTSQATSLIARRSVCPPEQVSAPCPAAMQEDPCGEESYIAPCPPPQVSTPQPRQRPSGLSGLRPPSRLMGPGAFSRPPQPKPQKIVLLPGDINPHETTVITVEPPPPEPCRPRSPETGLVWNPPPSVPFDLSPPSMDAFRRDPTFGIPPMPYIPPEILAMAEEAEPCPESVTDFEAPQYETSSALLVDVEPLDPCTMEPKVYIEPVDLITFSAPDPFSPERLCRPPSPSVTPPPNPFTPPKDPIPEPSELDKWAAQYPRYKEAYASSFHPIGEWAKLKYQQKATQPQERTVKYVDRELVARSIPFNKNVSTICKDESYYDDLGLLPDFEDDFAAPLDYAAIKRQEEMERMVRESRRKKEKGPTLAETREMLARVRQEESSRRSELSSNVMSSCRPAPLTEEEMRGIHDRIMAKHAGQSVQEECRLETTRTGGFIDDIQLDDIDLDAIDNMDECLVDF